jgi:hypothetical protein
MRKLLLLASVGALAVSVPVLAFEQDRGRGGGQGKGQGVEANQKGAGKSRAERGRGRGGEARAERRGRGDEARAERRGSGREDRRAESRPDRKDRRVERTIRDQRREAREARRIDGDRRDIREARRVDRRDWDRWFERRRALRDRFDDRFVGSRRDRGRRLAVGPNGCPPGLARQNRFCMPPGQLRKARLIGQRLPLAQLGYNIPERYRYRFADGGDWIYRYDDMGHVFRLGRGSGVVDAVFPLFANNLMIGEPLPLGYEVYNVPLAYRGFYPDTRDSFYRYDDRAIYRVDSDTRMVQGIAALLTGGQGGLGGLGVGDTLPAGYGVYNVPFDYRDRYYDTNDSMYRYADRSIYQVDPQTRLIQSIISLLV